MKVGILSFFSLLILIPPSDFIAEQKKYERVRTAYEEKGAFVTETLKNANININNVNILINAYKEESLLELYAKNKVDETYKKIATYSICEKSGTLGPKRKQGDGQVPEGFYYIDRFNPASFYYLSLGINYPNLSDKRKSTFSKLGGDIFIHGSCVTIGCLPMTDEKIKEIYLYAIQAKQNGQAKIPVCIYPFKMTNENIQRYKKVYANNKALCSFWDNLKIGYQKFELEKMELTPSISENGNYVF